MQWLTLFDQDELERTALSPASDHAISVPTSSLWDNEDWAVAQVAFGSPEDEYYLQVRGRGDLGRSLVYANWIMHHLPDKALNDLFAELVDIVRYYLMPPQPALPLPSRSSTTSAQIRT